MVFGQLCAPALIYIVFSITQITMDSLKGMYNVAFVKLFISFLFTILLNHLCQRGLGIISWVIVFIPFMLMSLITALLIALLGIDAQTGKLRTQSDETEAPKELDVREKAIANYGMNRSKDDYLKRLNELGYMKLNERAGQNVINPSHNNLYDSTESKSEYKLVKSGSSRNKMKTKILAEEIYFLLKSKISNNEIKLENDLGGKVKKMVIEHCDTSIDLIYQDLHYRLSKIYGVYDEEDSKHEEGIRKALSDISNWGVLRNIEGNTVLSEEMDIKSFRDYSDLMVVSDPKWIDRVMSNYKRKIVSSKYETRCEKIQVKINNYADQNSIDFSDILKNDGESSYNDVYEDAYTSAISGSGSLWSREPTEQKNRQYTDLPKTAETTTNICQGQIAPCKTGKCYGVGESCSKNDVCGTGCCSPPRGSNGERLYGAAGGGGKCKYYDENYGGPAGESTEPEKWTKGRGFTYKVMTKGKAFCGNGTTPDTTMIWTGKVCDDNGDIEWTEMNSDGCGTSADKAVWKRSATDDGWNKTYIGYCGLSPTYTPSLPKNISNLNSNDIVNSDVIIQ